MRIIFGIFSVIMMSHSSAFAQTLVDRLMAESPRRFECTPSKVPDLGHICVSTKAPDFGYSQKIVMLIPKNLDRPNRMALHFHGWRGVCESDSVTPTQLAVGNRLLEQLIEANANDTVLFFPVSTYHNDQHTSQLAPNYKAFTRWAEAIVNPLNRRWLISGHSGAYAPMNVILGSADQEALSRIETVGFIDATYSSSSPSKLQRAQGINKSMLIYTSYIPGSQTASVALQIKNSSSLILKKVVPTNALKYCSALRKIRPSADCGLHCEAPRRDFSDFLTFTARSRARMPNPLPSLL